MHALLWIPAPVWLCLSALCFAAGEFLSKKWALHPTPAGVLAVLSAYGCSSLLWLPALFHRNQLALMGTLWLLLGTVLTLAIGCAAFGETLTVKQAAGFAAALVALVLLSA